MRILLVRHGETVHNVKGLYAGSTDSALTVHGKLQAARLGAYLTTPPASSTPTTPPPPYRFTHLFSSDLQRARITAEAILDAQRAHYGAEGVTAGLALAQTPLLQEQHFGSLEEQSFLSGRGAPKAASADGKQRAYRPWEDDGSGGVEGMETRARVAERVGRFVDEFLVPLAVTEEVDGDEGERVVAVVSHGITAGFVWRAVVGRVTVPPVREGPVLENLMQPPHLPNTGYNEIRLVKIKPEEVPEAAEKDPLKGFALEIVGLQCRKHLDGLKRTGGGVGSSQADPTQRTLDGFIKSRQDAKAKEDELAQQAKEQEEKELKDEA